MPAGRPNDGPPSSSAQAGKRAAGLPFQVEQWYYKHGLFLSSYPTCATSVAIVVLLLCCYPLIYVPLPGTIPTKIVMPYAAGQDGGPAAGMSAVPQQTSNWNGTTDKSAIFLDFSHQNFTFEAPFPWSRQEPFVYVQQILFRVSVLPWTSDLILTDAYRGPLAEIFKLIEVIRNHEVEDPNGGGDGRKTTLSDICLHVENVKVMSAARENLLPEYNCLLLSPANFWQQNPQQFNKDPAVLNTIFQYHNFQKTKISIAEMLLGMKLKDSGIKRYPIRARTRIIQFAVTLMLKENDEPFLKSLRDKLADIYPLSKSHGLNSASSRASSSSSLMMIYYPGKFNVFEVLPLVVTLSLLFFYFYFFLKKMDLIRSRIVLAVAAILTIVGSLIMSLGFCFFFGLTISNQLKGIIPYLVVLVGLENVLVITKCVLSTDETLDVKIRVARGLSREGWSISKTLLTEITILTVGLATFVPFIQEFCIFAIVGLISDFFLQMLFFSTILAMVIKPYNHSVKIEQRRRLYDTPNSAADWNENSHYLKYSSSSHATAGGGGMSRSQSHPKLSSMDNCVSTDVIATRSSLKEKRIPKRLKIVNFWARTRFFQRCFMIWMIVWISMIIYNTGVIESLFDIQVGRDGHRQKFTTTTTTKPEPYSKTAKESAAAMDALSEELQTDERLNKVASDGRGQATRRESSTRQDELKYSFNYTDSVNRLKFPPEYETSNFLSNFHWSSILKQYNISLTGNYITILPSIKLSHFLYPKDVIKLRNPNEKSPQHFQWKALAVALDPIDFSDMDNSYEDGFVADEAQRRLVDGGGATHPYSTPLYPKSPMEIFFAAILAGISIFVLTYTMVVMYRCICTRNYAEWRASWTDQATEVVAPNKVQNILQNSVPISIKGHRNAIECLASDGSLVASSCLEGRIKIWDVMSGQLVTNIVRDSVKGAQIWCLDFVDNLIAVGCADGRLEFWEGSTGNQKCILEGASNCKSGVTHIKLIGDQVIVARLCGQVDFLKMESYNHGKQIDWRFTSAYRRTHVRTGSTGSLGHFNVATNNNNATNNNTVNHSNNNSLIQRPSTGAAAASKISGEELKCVVQAQLQGHQQPITCMDVARNTLFTGSQDHTLKVFKLSGHSLQYTLHGHCGAITCLFIDQRHGPSTGGSGSQDGLLCVWDLDSGACTYGIQAHDGAVLSIVGSPSYVISLGADNRLCVWERFQGHLLNSIHVAYPYSALLMLTPSLLLTSSKPGSLLVWDVRTGEPTKEVKLDCASQLCPNLILPASDCIICDYGNELRIVRFPIVAEKLE